MTAATETILRGLIDAMTERADELQQLAVRALSDDIGVRRAECAAGVRQARAMVEGALAAVKVLAQPTTDRDAEVLDALNLLLSAPEWPGASGMEDVCDLVRTVRSEIPDAPEWESH